ncbi:MAG TPA: CPBP family intramembrane glutamic endopeptidase [Gemmatimonadaceae bacterium]
MALRIRNLQWPPRALGLGPPLNAMLFSADRRRSLRKSALESAALGAGAALIVMAIDHYFFDGLTARQTPEWSEHPAPAMRLVIAFTGALFEEIVFRVIVATTVATVLWLVLRRITASSAVQISQWAGTISAATWIALWHVGMAGDPARIITINAVGNILYGWIYWRRGLESAVVAHATVTSILFLGFPFIA